MLIPILLITDPEGVQALATDLGTIKRESHSVASKTRRLLFIIRRSFTELTRPPVKHAGLISSGVRYAGLLAKLFGTISAVGDETLRGFPPTSI